MKKMNKWLQRCRAAGRTFSAALAMFLLNGRIAYASSSINQSRLALGTERLIKDATSWLMVLAPIVAGLLIIYFCIRRSAADEMDQKKWIRLPVSRQAALRLKHNLLFSDSICFTPDN